MLADGIFLVRNLFIGNALVDMYSKCDAIERARDMFIIRDTVSWNALISGYTQWGDAEKAIQCFKMMKNQASCQT